MFASTGPVRFSRRTPSRWKAMPVAVSAQGIWMQPLQAAAWAGVSGASDAPKSTARAVICAIPVPEPTAAYVTLSPYLRWKSEAQRLSSGAISVEPAPVSEVLLAPAGLGTSPAVRHVITAATATIGNLFGVKGLSLLDGSGFRRSQHHDRHTCNCVNVVNTRRMPRVSAQTPHTGEKVRSRRACKNAVNGGERPTGRRRT